MNEAIQLMLFLVLLAVLAPLLGSYMAKVFMGEKHFMKPVFGWLEKLVYQASGVKSEDEMKSFLEDKEKVKQTAKLFRDKVAADRKRLGL